MLVEYLTTCLQLADGMSLGHVIDTFFRANIPTSHEAWDNRKSTVINRGSLMCLHFETIQSRQGQTRCGWDTHEPFLAHLLMKIWMFRLLYMRIAHLIRSKRVSHLTDVMENGLIFKFPLRPKNPSRFEQNLRFRIDAWDLRYKITLGRLTKMSGE